MSAIQTIEVWPPLLTPFTEQGAVDEPALDALVDFFLHLGVTGLLVTGLSGEPFQMKPDERLSIVRRVSARVASRVPVAAPAFPGEDKDWATAIGAVREAGANIAVLLTSTMVSADEPDSALLEQLDAAIEASEGDLGLYEIPVPYKRLLTLEALARAASSGRFTFFKDTCQNLTTIKERLAVIKGSRLRLYNAEMASLRASVAAGAHGFCGLMANIVPQLLAPAALTEGARGEQLNLLLDLGDAALGKEYPASAKYLLHRAYGLELSSFSRSLGRVAALPEVRSLEALHQLLINEEWLP